MTFRLLWLGCSFFAALLFGLSGNDGGRAHSAIKPLNAASEIQTNHRDRSANVGVGRNDVPYYGANKINSREWNENAAIKALITPCIPAPHEEKWPVTSGWTGLADLGFSHHFSTGLRGSQDGQPPAYRGALNLDECGFERVRNPITEQICATKTQNEVLKLRHCSGYELIQSGASLICPLRYHLRDFTSGELRLVRARRNKYAVLDSAYFTSVILVFYGESVRVHFYPPTVRANSSFALVADAHANGSAENRTAKQEQKQQNEIKYVRINGPQTPEEWAREEFMTDPETKGAIIPAQTNDIDVSSDGKHWFHLIGNKCIKNCPRLPVGDRGLSVPDL